MIRWKDFILDDFIGPVLAHLPLGEDEVIRVVNSKGCKKIFCEESRITGVMEDEEGINGGYLKTPIQETGQEKRPARMAGLSSLDSAEASMEAERFMRLNSSQNGGEG